MVTAADILALAEKLLRQQEEVADRSAASRAYYAAFWHCLDIVEGRFGPVEEQGPEVHGELTRLIALWDEEAGGLLRDLRRIRNDADYDRVLPLGRLRAEFAVDTARALLSLS